MVFSRVSVSPKIQSFETSDVTVTLLKIALKPQDLETNTSSMARTTGYTAAAAANILLENKFSEKGVFPPELVGKHEVCFYYFLSYLEQRNIIYQKKSKILE